MAKKRKSNQPQKPIKQNTLPQWFPVATFIALGILIFYPPFVRGLFFKEDMFLYHVFTAIVFTLIWVIKIYQKDYTLLKTPLDWAILAYAGAYLLSLIGAVHPGEAFYGFLRALNYFMVFWMVTQVVKNYQTYETILKILLAAGTGVAVIGILAATGYSNYPSAFDGRVILSTLQYPNTTGAYLAVISLLTVSLIMVAKKLSTKIIYLTATFLMILVILCTLSKGAWVIFVVGALLLLLGMPGLFKIKSLYVLGIAFLAAGITYTKFYPAIIAKETALPYLLIGLFIVIVGQLVWEGLYQLNKRFNSKAIIIAVSLITLITLGTGSAFFLGGSSFEAQDITRELSRLTDFSDNSYTSRVDFIRWGLAIVKDYPINGAGSGGWNALYHQYQDYLFFTTEAHNHFIQVWVEAGTIGLIAFLAIWLLLILTTYRIYKREKEQDNLTGQILVWGTFTAAMALGFHAAMDFDLSLAAIALLLWILFALISAASCFNEETVKITALNRVHPIFNIGISVICILILLTCGSCYHIAYKHAVKAATAIQAMTPDKSAEEQNKYYQKALKHYQKATRLDSNNAEYFADLAYTYALLYSSLKQADHQLTSQAYHDTVVAIEKAEQLKGFDPKVRSSLLNTAGILGDFELMLRQAEGAVLSNPNDINAYESLVNVLMAGLNHYQEANDEAQVNNIATNLANVEKQIEKQKTKINPDKRWYGNPLKLSSEANLNIAKANYILGEYDKSLSTFEKYINNLIEFEFEDVEFANTFLENESWLIESIKDNEASNGTALKVIAKKDLGGWSTILNLASQVDVHEGTEYILEIRYRIDNLTHGNIADTPNTLNIFSRHNGTAGTKNIDFSFFQGEVSMPTKWKVAMQKIVVEPGYNTRSLWMGTGSIGSGSTFYVDYVRLYPVLNETTSETILEQYNWYAASLYKNGNTAEASRIAETIKKINPDKYTQYMELIKR